MVHYAFQVVQKNILNMCRDVQPANWPKKSSWVCWDIFGWKSVRGSRVDKYLFSWGEHLNKSIRNNCVSFLEANKFAIQAIFFVVVFCWVSRTMGRWTKLVKARTNKNQQVIQATRDPTWRSPTLVRKRSRFHSPSQKKRSRKPQNCQEKKLPACFCREFSAIFFDVFVIFTSYFQGILQGSEAPSSLRHFDNFPSISSHLQVENKTEPKNNEPPNITKSPI